MIALKCRAELEVFEYRQLCTFLINFEGKLDKLGYLSATDGVSFPLSGYKLNLLAVALRGGCGLYFFPNENRSGVVLSDTRSL